MTGVFVVVLVDGVVGLLGDVVDPESVKTMKESKNKETPRLSRFITVRVCCPSVRVGDLNASVDDCIVLLLYTVGLPPSMA